MDNNQQTPEYLFRKDGYSLQNIDHGVFGPVQPMFAPGRVPPTAIASPKLRPNDILQAAASTFLAKNAEYGDNYLRFPRALLALFPGGKIPEISTEADASRLQLLIQILNKMTRYAETFSVGGHRDSARDIIVYAAMLEEQTR